MKEQSNSFQVLTRGWSVHCQLEMPRAPKKLGLGIRGGFPAERGLSTT